MFERKAPLINGIAALGNLAEAFLHGGRYVVAPTPDALQGLYESLIVAGENAWIYLFSYILSREKKTQNVTGGLVNTALGGLHYGIDQILTHVPNKDGTRCPPQSLSRAVQPLINIIGIEANAIEFGTSK